MVGLDANSIGYGLLAGIIGILGLAYFISQKRANTYQDEAQKAEAVVKVQTKQEEDDADPVADAISSFDSELDADNKSKPGGGSNSQGE
jgi:hypothetical protein